MIVQVDAASAVPAYEQLRHQLTSMIAAGTLAVGERLPAIRRLAGDLDLAPGTVARAYRELEAAGLVVAAGRRGTRVAPRSNWKAATSDVLAVLDAAAQQYATTVLQLDVGLDEALDAVRQAVNEAGETRAAETKTAGATTV